MTPGVKVGIATGLAAALWWLASGRASARVGGAREVGAWAYGDAFGDADAYARDARAMGVTHLDVMVNGNKQLDWHIRPTADIERACRVWRSAGLAVSLTTWVRPAVDWIAGAREVAALARSCRAGVTLDIEEPWTLGGATEADAVALEHALRHSAPGGRAASVRVCGTGIVYAPDAAAPLLRRCDYTLPQTYATTRNAGALRVAADGVTGSLEVYGRDRYRRLYGRPVPVLGAAAWSLEGAYGLGSVDALRVSLGAAKRLGCGVRFWNFGLLRSNAAFQDAVREVMR